MQILMTSNGTCSKMLESEHLQSHSYNSYIVNMSMKGHSRAPNDYRPVALTSSKDMLKAGPPASQTHYEGVPRPSTFCIPGLVNRATC